MKLEFVIRASVNVTSEQKKDFLCNYNIKQIDVPFFNESSNLFSIMKHNIINFNERRILKTNSCRFRDNLHSPLRKTFCSVQLDLDFCSSQWYVTFHWNYQYWNYRILIDKLICLLNISSSRKKNYASLNKYNLHEMQHDKWEERDGESIACQPHARSLIIRSYIQTQPRGIRNSLLFAQYNRRNIFLFNKKRKEKTRD